MGEGGGEGGWEGGVPNLRFLDRLIQPWMGGRGVSGLRFLDRLIQPWMGGRGGKGGPSLSKGENFLTPDFA